MLNYIPCLNRILYSKSASWNEDIGENKTFEGVKKEVYEFRERIQVKRVSDKKRKRKREIAEKGE